MVIALGASAFFVFGCLLVLVGSVGASLQAAFEIGLEEIGVLAAILSGGLGAGVVLAGPVVDRWARRPLFVGATALAAAAMGLASMAESFLGVALALALAGFGAGLFETVLNATLSEGSPDGTGWSADRRLALVHAGATLGAVVAPFAFGFAVAEGEFAAAFRGMGAAFLAIAGFGVLVEFPRSSTGVDPSSGNGARLGQSWLGLVPLLIAGGAYVGFETALTAFAPNLGPSSDGDGTGAISAFWFGLLVSRLAFLFRPGPGGARWLLGAGLASAAVMATGWSSGFLSPLEFALAGLALGTTFPLLMALTAQQFPERRGTAIGLVAGAGALGGVVVPWAAGQVADGWGLTAVVGILVACCLLLAICAWRLLLPRTNVAKIAAT